VGNVEREAAGGKGTKTSRALTGGEIAGRRCKKKKKREKKEKT